MGSSISVTFIERVVQQHYTGEIIQSCMKVGCTVGIRVSVAMDEILTS